MKKFLFLIIVMLLFTNLLGISEFACMFTLINPSARGTAFGNDSGAADIWDTSPLGVWSNPAKLGYHKNFAFGYSDKSWYGSIFNDMSHRSSYISYGWNGIGVLLPAPSSHKKWGTVMSYGKQDQLDEDGNILSTFESYDACSKIAVGINTIEFLSNFISNENLRLFRHYGDLSIGFDINIINSDLAPEGTGTSETGIKGTGNGFSTGIGFISRVSPLNNFNVSNKFYRLDLTAGMYFINPFKSKIHYENELQSDFLPYGIKSSFSGKFSIDINIIPELDNDYVRCFVNNLFSIYYSQDNDQLGKRSDENPSTWGEGFEYTFLDIFSIRNGHYEDKYGEIVGDTSGYGINLNYKEIFQFQYNHSEIPGGELQNTNEMDDYLVRIDFIKAYGLIKN